MTELRLPFGAGQLAVRIPDDLLGAVLSPRPVAAAPDPGAEIRAALDRPVGAPRLEELARPGQRVAVLVDDITRETPTAQMLPPVLRRLAAAGVARRDICLVLALGTHRPMTEAEIALKVGPEIAREFAVVNDSCWDNDKFVYRGDSTNGIPAWVHRAVAEADLRIGLGAITPHSDAGFSGGAKIVLPGVCGGRTVDAFHARCAAVAQNVLGRVDNSTRQDLEQLVGERVGLEFILNAVLTPGGQIYRCVAGHFLQAHRAGVQPAQEVYGVPAARRYPLVIANAHPCEIDLWQSSKGLWAGEPLTRDGGLLLLLTPCPEGIHIHPQFADYVNRDPDELWAELQAGQAADPNAAGGAIPVGRMKRRIRFGLVSPGLGRPEAARMGFAYYNSVEEAIAAEAPPGNGAGSVAVVTHGGFTIPLVA